MSVWLGCGSSWCGFVSWFGLDWSLQWINIILNKTNFRELFMIYFGIMNGVNLFMLNVGKNVPLMNLPW